MSYQVLARKWRPRSFREMVGQAHVLRALISALDTGRLHHAYLFTGTRGVGKTTIARIMAKCLNCEQGVSSTPCGECSICCEIDEGRFVDLIEVDAASKTKVEDTRELLDNVQYMPARGRYKVYLIDEVHMLSTSSFNALLKTLEEPPEHVKFLLATTDPQKLPATVLSRCLQFSLKNMPPEAVVGHLAHVLGSENIPHEEQALWLLGRAADGSMRDAMSLTDQAVAFGEGKVVAEDVRAMLGTLDQGQVFGVLQALVEADASALLQAIRQLADHGPDWMGVLGELLGVLHRTAVAQMLPDAVDNSQGDREQILQLAGSLTAEDVQFYYQAGLLGRRDLPLAPDPRDGFEMVMLRMLAFRPASLPGAPRTPLVFNETGSAGSDSPATSPISETEKTAALQTDAAQDGSPETVSTSDKANSAEPASPIAIDESVQDAAEDTELAPWEEQPDAEISDAETAVNSIPAEASVESTAVATEMDPPAIPQLEPVSASPAGALEQDFPAPAPAPATAQEVGVAQEATAVSEAVVETDQEPATATVAQTPLETDAVDSEDSAEEDEAAELAAMLDEAANAYLDWQPQVDELEMLQQERESDAIDLRPEIPPASGLAARWIELCESMALTGITGNIVRNATLVAEEGDRWQLHLDPEHSALFTDIQRKRVNESLNQATGRVIELHVDLQPPEAETPGLALARRRARQQADAVLSIEQDPLVQGLIRDFAAQIVPDSIRPLDPL